MATGRTDRSTKALHNFTMPRELRWGNQKHLRCMKVNSGGRISPYARSAAVEAYSPDRRRENPAKHRRRGGDAEREGGRDSYPEFLHGSHRLGRAPPPAWDGGRRFCDGDGDDGIAALREKVMLDLRTEADRMKFAIFMDGLDEGAASGSPPHPPPSLPAAEVEIDRPWSLRTRRAACGTPIRTPGFSPNGGAAGGAGGENVSAGGGKGSAVDGLKPDSGSCQTRAAASALDKSLRLRSGGGGAAAIGEKRERPKFAVALSKSEIEEDFFGMTGHRPARRPKKRVRNVQRQLDTLFPGLWLTEITADMYKVAEAVAP